GGGRPLPGPRRGEGGGGPAIPDAAMRRSRPNRAAGLGEAGPAYTSGRAEAVAEGLPPGLGGPLLGLPLASALAGAPLPTRPPAGGRGMPLLGPGRPRPPL